MARWPQLFALALTAATGLSAALLIVPAVYEDDLSTPRDAREIDWAGSSSCAACHPDRHASWRRTFHRSMTQTAGPDSVVGRFDGSDVTFFGVAARAVSTDGRYYFEFLDGETGAVTRRLEVERTVGSRRYQQYLVRDPELGEDNYYRVPIAWHIGERRWIHLNGAFLDPDGIDYDEHLAPWDNNCIFCHNTGPEPRIQNLDQLLSSSVPVDPVWDGRFRSVTAELGIACGSCHAPGAEHARLNRNPFRRYLLHLSGRADPTIVNPALLDPARSAAVCGQCHGQRMPRPMERIQEWIEDGPTYRAGDDLLEHVEPVFRSTPPPAPADPELFSLRFWPDGTPRLTAYEYQGLLLSPCHQKGELTCISCHTMHEGDVFGQLPPENRTSEACRSCHADLVDAVAEHSRHDPAGPGADCYACHMPEAVYGVLEIHRSHRIENPDAVRDALAGRPNACTNCHLDRSLRWAAEELAKGWGTGGALPPLRRDGARIELPDSIAALLAGDPVQRAVAAQRASRVDVDLADGGEALIPFLLLALEDEYPAVRWFARRSLLALDHPALAPELTSFDYLGEPDLRARALARLQVLWREHAATLPPAPAWAPLTADWQPRAEVAALRVLQTSKRISIGE